jgi:hypothetical protein
MFNNPASWSSKVPRDLLIASKPPMTRVEITPRPSPNGTVRLRRGTARMARVVKPEAMSTLR